MDETLDLQECLPKVTTICQGCYQKIIFNRSILYAIKYPDQLGSSVLIGTPEQLSRNPEIQSIDNAVKAIVNAYKLRKTTLSSKSLSSQHQFNSAKEIPQVRKHDTSHLLSQSVRRPSIRHTKVSTPSFLPTLSDDSSKFGASVVSTRLRRPLKSDNSIADSDNDSPRRRYESSEAIVIDEPLPMDEAMVLLNEYSSSCSQATLHPLCVRCAQTRSLAIDSAIRNFRDEITRYKAVFNTSHSSSSSSSSSSGSRPSDGKSGGNNAQGEYFWLEEDEEKLDKELDFYLKEEKRLQDELLRVSAKRQSIKHKISQLKQSTKHLKELERKYWKNYNHQRDIMAEQCLQMRDQYTTLKWKTQRLNALCHTVVLEDAFRIDHSGFFGTVNGMRLGKLPSASVDWGEINCGLGYLALLLNGISKGMDGVKFPNKVMLVGNSSLVAVGRFDTLNLFNDGSKLFGVKRLDDALSEVLKIVNAMGEYCSKIDKDFFFPYVIGTDKVGKFPVKFVSKDEIGLSQGMKCLLTDIKFILSWIVPRFKRN